VLGDHFAILCNRPRASAYATTRADASFKTWRNIRLDPAKHFFAILFNYFPRPA